MSTSVDGVPVVLVHGLRTSRTMWRAQVDALEAYGRRAVALDLPGHGTRSGTRFTSAGAVNAVRDAVDGAGGRALVVGLSLGGYTAIAHAARHPEQAVGVVAAGCCTQPSRMLVGGWAVAAQGFARMPDRGAAVNGFLVRHVLPPAGARDVAAGGFALDVVEDVLREVGRTDPLTDLARVEAPVWLVNGRLDHFRTQERRFVAAAPDARLVVVPGATHLVSLVAPVRFTRVVLEAADEVDRRAGG
ncbi:alpha/beta fold hydrolase [Cellulomonas sp. SLBN-39]|uniref:alpha/beta fold hydrolase n=1 Tax=Cellulomonas sp. SLBN-39 TaxID=2768446 RepID=UPI00116B08CB|nr:alpha/beta hydrolase [Cellulomonas sp. SLBN-39]TQL03396.1 pimeloyl-ACP methyl ester carboxylesterase [Cellulomonas sp. SLBN-39]